LTVVVGWLIEAIRARSLVLFAKSLTLREALNGLESGAPEALIRLEEAMEERDSYTRHHMSRTAFVATAIAREMGCDDMTVAIVEGAARIHDIGKIGVPDAILLKAGPLTTREFAQVKGHTGRGERIALSAGSLAHLAPIVRAHHERYSGCGYPDGLAGDSIPVAARIVAVADTFDALTSTRSYRSARSVATALHEMERVSGTQLDPQCVRAFLRWFEREGWDEFEPDEATSGLILLAA
jgi:HD-GYP domain-containing protein (c-di-GMP phosphodiesterase class II)